MFKIRNIAIRQIADFGLPFLAAIKHCYYRKTIFFGSLNSMYCILKYNGCTAVSAKMLHSFLENDRLILAMSNLTAGEDRIKIVFHYTSAESGFYLVPVRCRRNTHRDLSFFHTFQKIHNTRLRQNLVDIKMLDDLIDACHNLLCRKRQVIFFL